MKLLFSENLKKIPTILVCLLIAASGLIKLSGHPVLIEHYTQLGVVQYLKLLGIGELAFVAMFIHPRGIMTGFVLLTAYFGGAIATEISHGNPPFPAFVILILVCLSARLRMPAAFCSKHSQKKIAFTS